MTRSPLFILILVPWVGAKPVTDQPTEPDQTRTGQVSDQLVCYNVTDPVAKNTSVIYRSKDEFKLFDRKGKGPLPDCSEPESVKLDTCRVCELQEQVLGLCHLSDPSADLEFEAGEVKATPLQKTLCVPTTTLAPTTLSTAPPPQPTTLSTAPPPQPTTLSTASPGLIAGICVVVLVALVGGAVAFTQRENIRSWIKRCYRTRVPTMDQEMTERAPTTNGPAPPPLEAPSPETLGLEVSLKDSFSE